MFAEHCFELRKSSRVLVLKLNASGTICVFFSECGHVTGQQRLGDQIGLGLETIALLWLCTIATSADAQRRRAIMMTHAKVERCKAAH